MISSLLLNFSDLKNIIKSLTKISIYISILILILIPFGLKDQFEFGKLLGLASLTSFILTTLPGIIRRFELAGIFRQIQILLTFCRAQFGILMFLLATSHYIIVFLYPYFSVGQLPPIKLYTAVSAIAFYLAFPLFVTSNTWARRYLKKNWQRLHNITYLITWLLFLHVALQGQLAIAMVILLAAVFQLASFGYGFLVKTSSEPK